MKTNLLFNAAYPIFFPVNHGGNIAGPVPLYVSIPLAIFAVLGFVWVILVFGKDLLDEVVSFIKFRDMDSLSFILLGLIVIAASMLPMLIIYGLCFR